MLRWLLAVVLIALLLWPYAMRNVAYGTINVALGNRPISAEQRAALFALTQTAFADQHDSASDFSAEVRDSDLSTQSFLAAEQYLYRGDLKAAASHFALLAENDLLALQQTVGGAWVLMLDDTGQIVLDSFDDKQAWIADASVNVRDLIFANEHGVGRLHFTNTVEQRDLAGFTLPTGSVPLRYHDALAVRFKANPQSTLTVEALIDGSMQRLLAYHQGNGDWETIVIPLAGSYLESIRVLAHEPDRSPLAETHAIWLDWIVLEPATTHAGD